MIKFCLVFTLLITGVQLEAQKIELQELSDSVRSLSVKLLNLKQDIKIREEKFELKTDQILYEKSREIDDKVAETKNTQWKIMGVLGLLGLGGLGGFFILLYKNKQRVEAAMQERMDSLIKSKRSYFQDLIRDQEIESRIIVEDKFLVLSATAVAEKEVQTILNSLGFPHENIEYFQLGPDQKITKEILPENQIILINNAKGSLGADSVLEVFKHAPSDAIMLGYTTGENNRLPYNPRLNNANSKFTLYNNLILLAKYRRITGENIPS
jgi:hypothetical protein